MQAFNEYKKKHRKDAKLPSTKELSAEYSAVLERKKKSYAEYRKTKTEMQDWLTAQKIVQAVLGEEQEKRQEQLRQEAQEQQENR